MSLSVAFFVANNVGMKRKNIMKHNQNQNEQRRHFNHHQGDQRHNFNQHQNAHGYQSRSIDIESLYNQLSRAISDRALYEQRQTNLWNLISVARTDHSNEMANINKLIGISTHRANEVISQLCHYNKTHRAMNLADSYLQKEIARIQKIINKWNYTISEVESGRRYLISSYGQQHTNTEGSRDYVKKKEEQLQHLRQWQIYVHNHREK
jgi:hypothetical protein